MHINAHRAACVVLGVLILSAAGAIRAAAQGLPSVRVVAEEATVFERPEVLSGTVAVVRAGAILEAIDKSDGWYWVLMGRDENGSRVPGWIQADRVAVATPPNARDSLRTLQEELGALPASSPELLRNQRKEEREKARKAAEEARAAARLEEAARRVEEARKAYEDISQKGDTAK